jgi:parvulin-like peptidyl-prolyl isomerase
MLKLMRKYATGYMVKGIFGLIIIVFIFWGVGSFRGHEESVARIGSHEISLMEYQREYNHLLNAARMVYKDKLDENVLRELKLKEKAMDALIDRYILLKNAEDIGMTVSDREFTEYLYNIEMFKRDGQFNERLYEEVLKRNGMDPKQFEQTERNALVIARMIGLIRDTGMLLSDRDIWTMYTRERGKVNLGYVEYDAVSFRGRVRVDDREVLNAYEKEKGAHKGENVYRLRYITIDAKSPVKDDVAYVELLKQRDLETYAKEHHLPVVDLGPRPESEVLSKFKSLNVEEWLKGLKKGEISLPVRSDAKSFIFQLVDVAEGKPIDKDLALREIRERITGEKARVAARKACEEAIEKKSADSKNETGLIPRNATNLPRLGPVPKEDAGILALLKDNRIYRKPVEMGGKFYLFYYKNESLPPKEQWDKEKEGYKRYVLAREKDNFLKSFMETLRKREKIKIDRQEVKQG